MFRDRDGDETKRVLAGLRAFRPRALIERQPQRYPQAEGGDRRCQEQRFTQPAAVRTLAAGTL